MKTVIKTKFVLAILSATALEAALFGGTAAARPSFVEGAPGLDSSYSAGYSSQKTMQEFHRDIREFKNGEAAVPYEEDPEVTSTKFVPSSAQPQGTAALDMIGPTPHDQAFKFHSGFSHTMVYDSNINDTRLDPVDDLITLPNVWMGVTRGREGVSNYYFENSYGLGYMDYVENDKFDRMTHANYTQFDWRGKKLSVSLQNEFNPLSPNGVANRQELRSAGAVNSVTTTANTFAFKSAYEITPKLKLDHTWTHTYLHYPAGAKGGNTEIELQSHQTHSLKPRLTYALTPKTKIFVFYEFETADYFKGGTFAFKSHSTQAGFSTAFTPKISYFFQAGFKVRDLNQPIYEDGELFLYETALRYEVRPKLYLSAFLAGDSGDGPDTTDPADATPSTAGTGIDEKTLGLALNWRISPKTNLAADAAVRLESRSGEITLPDPDNRSISFTRQLEKTNYTWGVNWRWARSAFDQYYIGYRYENKNASFKDFESEDHQVIASVNLNLDAMGVGYAR